MSRAAANAADAVIRSLDAEVAELRAELRKERARYRELQELSGSAIVRAHVARGKKDLSEVKARERLDALEDRMLSDEERRVVLTGLRYLLGEDVKVGDLRYINPLLRSAIQKLDYEEGEGEEVAALPEGS